MPTKGQILTNPITGDTYEYLQTAKDTNGELDYPDAPLTLVIWNDVRKQFKHIPEDILKGKDVCIYGKIILYKDKPEIVISNPNRIQESIKVNVN